MSTPVYTLKGGMMRYLLVDRDRQFEYLLTDRVTHVDVILVPKAELIDRYQLKGQLTNPETYLQGMMRSALDGGMTALAGIHLRDLITIPDDVYRRARQLGDATVARHKEEGARIEMTDKAPRKLAGAALLAQQRKQERERLAQLAEGQVVKDLAQGVSEDLKSKEDAGEPAVGLKGKGGGADPKPVQAKKIKELVDAAKPAAKALRKTEKVVERRAEKEAAKPPKPAPKVKPAIPIGFHRDRLKKDGKYTSASAMFKGLLLDNVDLPEKKQLTDEQIFAKVQGEFGLSDDKFSYVAWNRRWLKKEGAIA